MTTLRQIDTTRNPNPDDSDPDALFEAGRKHIEIGTELIDRARALVRAQGHRDGDRIVTAKDYAEFGYPSERAFADDLRTNIDSFGRPVRAYRKAVLAHLETRRRAPRLTGEDLDRDYAVAAGLRSA